MMDSDSFSETTATQFTVYWQPGCSSCLRAKEFLTAQGIDYLSVNVREDDTALSRLEALGARSIPVVTRGTDFAFAQDIDVLAKFVGIELTRDILPPDVLVDKLDLILLTAQRHIKQLPESILDTSLPGRDRTYLDLAFHVFMIPVAFLDAARGDELTFEHFERVPIDDMRQADKVAEFGEEVRLDLQQWWHSLDQYELPETVLTYYGCHSTHSVLERTCWHAAQHARQLMQLLINANIEPDGILDAALLAGLPLPEEVYDDEVKLT